jgi:16S rRNA (guanine527-N7)-methyltransferase
MDESLWFRNICRKNNLLISDSQLDAMENFAGKILEWNKKINLISRKDEQNIWRRHILGSVGFLFHHRIQPATGVIDIGTGGGFPGIPLAILLTENRFTLVDSVQKKIKAVQDILEKLRLPNVRAVAGRAEELGRQKEYLRVFDYVIARAVAPVNEIVKWGKPFLKPHARIPEAQAGLVDPGAILLLKGGDLEAEIRNTQLKTGIKDISVHNLVFNGSEESELIDKKLIIVQV